MDRTPPTRYCHTTSYLAASQHAIKPYNMNIQTKLNKYISLLIFQIQINQALLSYNVYTLQDFTNANEYTYVHF